MGEVPELAGLEDPTHGLRKLDETPAGRLVRCADLVTHVMRRDGLGLAEAAGHVVQALASVGDGLELFHLRRGALPAYAARWEPMRWRLSDPGRWNLGDTVPENYGVRHFTPFDFDERQYTDGMGRVSVPVHLLGHRLEWRGHDVEPVHTQTVADWLAMLGNQWRARAGLGSLDRGRGEPSSVAVRSSAARAAGLLGTAEVLALPVATVAPAEPVEPPAPALAVVVPLPVPSARPEPESREALVLRAVARLRVLKGQPGSKYGKKIYATVAAEFDQTESRIRKWEKQALKLEEKERQARAFDSLVACAGGRQGQSSQR